MSASVANVDVILDTNGLDVPSCPHGPALLFIQYNSQSSRSNIDKERKFFACSAFRDRKHCRFFQYADEKISKQKTAERNLLNQTFLPKFSHKEFHERFCKLHEQKEQVFCQTCKLLLLPEEVPDHRKHQVKTGTLTNIVKSPTAFFLPLEDNKTYAQYLFSESTVQFTLTTLQNLNITHVLCVGAPRIHEAVAGGNHLQGKLESLLLDLDDRYMQVLGRDQFCHFNMFNFHFFTGEESEDSYRNFVAPGGNKKVAIVTDPPFGGMVEALAKTMKKMLTDCREHADGDMEECDVPILWFFPYFLEKRVTDAVPSLHMLDYKVDYDNHTLFSGKKKKKGSPVRIFTNVPKREIRLPAEDGYRWCDICQQYSAPENKHCDKCQKCTSKDGTSYKHCELCQRCVKPSWKHCVSCGRCQLQDHKCGAIESAGCHICGEQGHRRRNCPNRTDSTRKRKLQHSESTSSKSKVKRRTKKKK